MQNFFKRSLYIASEIYANASEGKKKSAPHFVNLYGKRSRTSGRQNHFIAIRVLTYTDSPYHQDNHIGSTTPCRILKDCLVLN